YTSLTTAIKTYADGYLAIVEKYTPSTGALAEQFSRATGAPLSAADLTWSYASFLTAIARRAGQVPASWDASSANAVPNACAATSANAPYATATNTVFPTGQTSGSPACPTASSVAVTFNELESTTYEENVFVVGSITQLGNWDPANAVPLQANGYSSAYPLWSVTVALPAGTTFQYKYLIKEVGGEVVWESDPNRQFTVPRSCATTTTENDVW
ncbi:MAG: hypothetical protein LQ347_007091, partial [Umbilicaria vellea]